MYPTKLGSGAKMKSTTPRTRSSMTGKPDAAAAPAKRLLSW